MKQGPLLLSEDRALRELVCVAGRRWSTKEVFHAGRGLAGLDEHQVRR